MKRLWKLGLVFTFKYGASPGTHFAELDPGATFKFTNELDLFSTFKGHALEINWPGPALLIEFTQ